MRQTGGGAISESKKLKFFEVLSLIYTSEEAVSGKQNIEFLYFLSYHRP